MQAYDQEELYERTEYQYFQHQYYTKFGNRFDKIAYKILATPKLKSRTIPFDPYNRYCNLMIFLIFIILIYIFFIS